MPRRARGIRAAALAAVMIGVAFLPFAFAVPVAADPLPPVPFLWGVATSAYQVEGGIENNDWDFFVRQEKIRSRVGVEDGRGPFSLTFLGGEPPARLEPAREGVRFFEPKVYKRDFDYAKMLGLNAFRIGIEWARIEPTRDQFDQDALNQYKAMIQAMKARGLTPVVTLNHFSLPLWAIRPPVDYDYLNTKSIGKEDEYRNSLGGWGGDFGQEEMWNCKTRHNEETGQDECLPPSEWDEYVDFVVRQLKGDVDYWLTVNEPVGSYVGVGYVGGVWPPGFVGEGERAKKVLHALIEAHVRAYNLIHAVDTSDATGDGKSAVVGFAHAMFVVEPAGNNREAAKNIDYINNDYFLNGVLNGWEDTNYLNPGFGQPPERPDHICKDPEPRFCDAWKSKIKIHDKCDPALPMAERDCWVNKADFIGINYYRRVYGFFFVPAALGVPFMGGRFFDNLYGVGDQPHNLLNELGWEIFPQGIHDMIRRIKDNYDLPVMITENGLPERADRNRAAALVAHLQQIHRAVKGPDEALGTEDDAQVLGYLHWSMMDNWELAQGYRRNAQFGLFHVDREEDLDGDGQKDYRRQITEAAFAYQQIIAEGGLTDTALANAEKKFGTITPDGSAVIPPTETHGRLWESPEGDPNRVTVYLGHAEATQRPIGMIYWHDIREWRRMEDLRYLGGKLHFIERTLDRVTEQLKVRDQVASYSNGVWTGTATEGGVQRAWTAPPVPGAGLWEWSGSSPWGGSKFYVSKFEGTYLGKFLPSAEPKWREIKGVSLEERPGGRFLILDAEPLFTSTIRLTGMNTGTTVASPAGSWSARRSLVTTFTGLIAQRVFANLGDVLWIGNDKAVPSRAFAFAQRVVFPLGPTPPTSLLAFEPGAAWIPGEQLRFNSEMDPSSRMPLSGFTQQDVLGQIQMVSFEAGGRSYVSTSCFVVPFSADEACEGTWTSIAGFVANRIGPPPIIDAGPDQVMNEGTPVSFAGTFVDGAVTDVSSQITWNFGGGGTAAGTLTPSHTYGDNGVFTAILSVREDTGRITSDTLTITVVNVAPAATIASVASPNPLFILPGETLTFSGTFTDPGFLDTHSIGWDFGDGTTSTTAFGPGGAASFSATHAYASAGAFAVSLTVRDDDGGVGTATTTVVVLTPAQAAVALASSIQGLPLNEGQKTALVATLDASGDSIDRENAAAACRQLDAFINEVNALMRSGSIDASTANTLIQAAKAIKTSLGCP